MIPDSSEQVKKVAVEAKRLAVESSCTEIQPIHLFVSLIENSKIGEEFFSDLSFNPNDLIDKDPNKNSLGESEVDLSISSKQLINQARSFSVIYEFDELNCFCLLYGIMSSAEVMPVLMQNGINFAEVMNIVSNKGKDFAESMG